MTWRKPSFLQFEKKTYYGRTDRRTDRPSNRDARTHLKTLLLFTIVPRQLNDIQFIGAGILIPHRGILELKKEVRDFAVCGKRCVFSLFPSSPLTLNIYLWLGLHMISNERLDAISRNNFAIMSLNLLCILLYKLSIDISGYRDRRISIYIVLLYNAVDFSSLYNKSLFIHSMHGMPLV